MQFDSTLGHPWRTIHKKFRQFSVKCRLKLNGNFPQKIGVLILKHVSKLKLKLVGNSSFGLFYGTPRLPSNYIQQPQNEYFQKTFFIISWLLKWYFCWFPALSIRVPIVWLHCAISNSFMFLNAWTMVSFLKNLTSKNSH